MGAERTDYVMLAARLEYGTLDNDVIEEYIDNAYSNKVTIHKGLTVINDGMNGDYLFIGKVLAKSDEDGFLPMCPTPEGSSEIKKMIQDQFGIVLALVSVWVFSHWH